jgi:hypothetical protein
MWIPATAQAAGPAPPTYLSYSSVFLHSLETLWRRSQCSKNTTGMGKLYLAFYLVAVEVFRNSPL